jgi:hypothetical protein
MGAIMPKILPPTTTNAIVLPTSREFGRRSCDSEKLSDVVDAIPVSVIERPKGESATIQRKWHGEDGRACDHCDCDCDCDSVALRKIAVSSGLNSISVITAAA